MCFFYAVCIDCFTKLPILDFQFSSQNNLFAVSLSPNDFFSEEGKEGNGLSYLSSINLFKEFTKGFHV